MALPRDVVTGVTPASAPLAFGQLALRPSITIARLGLEHPTEGVSANQIATRQPPTQQPRHRSFSSTVSGRSQSEDATLPRDFSANILIVFPTV